MENFAFAPHVLSIFIGIGLAAASGFRIFLPLFLVSLGSYTGMIPMNESFEWLAGLPTLITTGVAMVVEILGYYIPYVDHLLDSLSVPMATVAGSVLFASQYLEMGTFPEWALALIAGGGTAAAISTGFAGTRAASTATTGGLGNGIVATTETFGAGILSILAFAAPLLTAIIAIVLIVVVVKIGKKIWSKYRVDDIEDHSYD